jgi:antirestriction protein
MIAQPHPKSEQAESDGPRIYVACLAAYNNGHLHGRWIDAAQDAKDIQSEISEMLRESPIPNAEEWAIHDYEGFEGAELAEYSSTETVVKLAGFVSEHGELGGKLLAHFGGDLEDAEAAFENYAGQHQSLVDFVQELTEETTEIPKSLIYYIDYAAMARDMELNGDLFAIELGFEDVRVFWAR